MKVTLRNLQLSLRPRHTYSEAEFRESPEFGPKAIALDGAVDAPYFLQVAKDGYRYNIDHHTGMPRMATRATCGQVLFNLKMGMGRHLDGVTVHINDCDQDVALATWLLINPHRVVDTSEPLLNKLTWAEDALDASGGVYPIPEESPLRQSLHWIFAPYEEARARGTIPTLDETGMLSILEATWRRIDDYLMGAGGSKREQRQFAAPYTIWREAEKLFAMVIENGNARSELAKRYRAFFSLRKSGELNHYTLVVPDVFVYFPVKKVYAALNEAEAQARMVPSSDFLEERWGGSDTIGGSPRSGSVLSWDAVFATTLKALHE